LEALFAHSATLADFQWQRKLGSVSTGSAAAAAPDSATKDSVDFATGSSRVNDNFKFVTPVANARLAFASLVRL